MSQFFNFFSTRNMLSLNLIWNFWQMMWNVLLMFLKMSLTSDNDVFEALYLLHWTYFDSGCPICRLRHCSSRPMECLIEKSFSLSVVRKHPLLSISPFWTCPWSVQLQHELDDELSGHILQLLFQSLLVINSERFCVALVSGYITLSTDSYNYDRLSSLWNLMHFSMEELMKSNHKQLTSRGDFDFLSSLHNFYY